MTLQGLPTMSLLGPAPPISSNHMHTSLGGHGLWARSPHSWAPGGGGCSRLQTFPTFLPKVRCLPCIGS